MKFFPFIAMSLAVLFFLTFIWSLSGHGLGFMGAAILPVSLILALFFFVASIRVLSRHRIADAETERENSRV